MAYCNVVPEVMPLPASVPSGILWCAGTTLVVRSYTGITNVMAQWSRLMGGSFCLMVCARRIELLSQPSEDWALIH